MKEINELDRLKVGVREWAIDSVFTKGFGLTRWLLSDEEEKRIDAKAVIEIATELENYVLREI